MPRASTANQKAYALITLYVKEYGAKYGAQPTGLNRHRDKWGFQDMVDDLGYENAQAVIKFYFTTGRVGHPLQFLLYNYEKLDVIRREMIEDEKKRLELREATRIRVEKWEREHGNS